MHIFKYSQRKGTKAAEMESQVDGKIKEERSNKLIELSKEVEVLIEEEKNGYYQGHTKNYILALIRSEKKLENEIIKAKCIGAESDHILLEMEQCNKIVINQ